jgi:hypothetical protein
VHLSSVVLAGTAYQCSCVDQRWNFYGFISLELQGWWSFKVREWVVPGLLSVVDARVSCGDCITSFGFLE